VVGSDNWALEVVPSLDPERAFVVHQHLVAVSGVYILENLDLGHVATTGVKAFLFVLSPIVARGATGALARPIAVL
jgi:kynurenine formamidase